MDKRLLDLGTKIKVERAKRRLSQADLAELSELSVRTISDVERGISDIRYTNLLQIAYAFGLSISDMLDFKY